MLAVHLLWRQHPHFQCLLRSKNSLQRFGPVCSFSSGADFLDPAAWQILVVVRVQLFWVTAWMQNFTACRFLLVLVQVTRVNERLVNYASVLVIWTYFCVHGRQLVRLDHLESIPSGRPAWFSLTWWILEVFAVGVSADARARSTARGHDINEFRPNASSIKLFLHCNGFWIVFKASQRHFWLCNLNRALRSNVFAVFAKCASLLGHDWLAALLLCQCLFTDLVGWFLQGDCRYAHSLSLHDSWLKGWVIDLLV